jgi:hypothetical protein
MGFAPLSIEIGDGNTEVWGLLAATYTWYLEKLLADDEEFAG